MAFNLRGQGGADCREQYFRHAEGNLELASPRGGLGGYAITPSRPNRGRHLVLTRGVRIELLGERPEVLSFVTRTGPRVRG